MSDILNNKKIETVFDHGVTKSEMDSLFGGEESYADYYLDISADDAYADLYFLYEIRNDHNQAIIFLNRISDENYKNRLSIRCNH